MPWGSPPLHSGGQNHRCPTSGQGGYITPAAWGVPTASEWGAALEVAHKWARWLHTGTGFLNVEQDAVFALQSSMRAGRSPQHAPIIKLGENLSGKCHEVYWLGQSLSIRAWCQVAVPSGYGKKKVARWVHRALQKAYAANPHMSEKSAGFVHQNIKHFPRPRCATLQWSCNGCKDMHAGEASPGVTTWATGYHCPSENGNDVFRTLRF